jgi:hypothetical protein
MAVLAGTMAWATEPKQEGVIDPKADAALRRMSDYVGGLKTFKVDATTVDEKVTADGQKVQALQQSTLTVRRPGELRVDRLGPNGHATFIYDGKRFALYNRDKKVYATEAAPPTLDEAVDKARERLHVDAPAADLIVPDSYDTLIDGVVTGRYIGLEPIDGVMAHHIAVTKDDVDWQLWIKDGPDAVPLRFVITSKDLPAQPQFTAEMHHWQPKVAVPASTFAFRPPPGAEHIKLTSDKAQR